MRTIDEDPEIDMLLFELDNVIDEELKSIPDELIYKCQLALTLWSIDGREDNERSYNDQFGYTYILGRKLHPHYHESLISFGDYCPSYMELKLWIIGDITGEIPLDAIISSGYLD